MQPAVPRYSTKSFPKYRYLPAVHPHPGIHPDGHSYGKEESPLPYQAPEKWNQNGSYLFGVDLFNYGYWWEAHEAWENIWLTTQKMDLYGQFLQSLIQYSAAMLKLYSGNKNGFDKLYSEASKRMDFCRAELPGNQHCFMGLHLAEWRQRLEIFRNTAKDPRGIVQDPLSYTNFPWIILSEKGQA